MRTAAYLILINGLALVAILALTEIILESLDTRHDRHLFFSKNSLAYDEEFDIVNYKKNSSLHTFAKYGDVVEYDTMFGTNNFGYIDTQDYHQGAPSVAVIGDSFAAGDGGEPWIPNLRPLFAKQNLQLLSLGVTGTGLHEFTDKLRWAHTKFDLRYAVILFIKGDRTRPDWWPLERDSAIYFCLPEESAEACARRGAIIDTDLTTNRSTFHADQPSFLKQWPLKMFPNTYLSLRDMKNWVMDNVFGRQRAFAESEYRSFLSELEKEFRDIPVLLVQIPEKQEIRDDEIVTLRQYRYPENVQYIALDECLPDISFYHQIDNHPNRQGYEQLEGCLREVLMEQCVHCALSGGNPG